MTESIGARLRQAREQRRLTVQQVSNTTKVRPHYLQALENDDLSAISSAAQARGFLRIYADFLGLNADELMLVKSPAELAASQQPINSSSDHILVTPEENTNKDKVIRQGLFGILLNRFTRREEKEHDNLQTADTATPIEKATPVEAASPIKTFASVEIPPAVEPTPSVPERVSEELPIKPDLPVEEPVLGIKAAATEPLLATESTPTVKAPRKTGSRPRKSSTPIDKQNVVKKKGNE